MSYTPTNWSTGDTITASALNKIEQGVANAGGGLYDAYDFVIKQIDTNTPTLEKGNYSDVYDALQDMEPVRGLFIKNVTPGPYYDTCCIFLPLTYVNYYSSIDSIYGLGVYNDGSGTSHLLRCDWESNGTITVNDYD